MRLEIVRQLVSRPPSQRVFTYGCPHVRVVLDRVLRLLLRADEEDRAAALRDVAGEVVRLLEQLERLLQVDDVDATRSVKMKRRIFGFQRLVWRPKCTPASKSSRMLTTACGDSPSVRFRSPAGSWNRRPSRRRHRHSRPPPGWSGKRRCIVAIRRPAPILRPWRARLRHWPRRFGRRPGTSPSSTSTKGYGRRRSLAPAPRQVGQLGDIPTFIVALSEEFGDPQPGRLRAGGQLAALVRDHARERRRSDRSAGDRHRIPAPAPRALALRLEAERRADGRGGARGRAAAERQPRPARRRVRRRLPTARPQSSPTKHGVTRSPGSSTTRRSRAASRQSSSGRSATSAG